MADEQKLTQFEVSGHPDGTYQMVPNPCGAWVRAHEAFEEIERLRKIENAALRVVSSIRRGAVTDDTVLDALANALEATS